MSSSSERQILNLIYSYCWLIDQGRFDELAELFSECDISVNGVLAMPKGGEKFAKGCYKNNIIYQDGTMKTMHLAMNPVIEIDEEADTASAKHYTVVTQGITGEFPPQIIVMDQKFDTFKRVDGVWRFATRNMVSRAAGDISHHQRIPLENNPYFPKG